MKEGDLVMARNFPAGKICLAGALRKSRGPLLFNVELEDCQILQRQLNHILKHQEASSTDHESERLALRVSRFLLQEVTKPSGEQQTTRVTTRTTCPLAIKLDTSTTKSI